MSFTGMWTRVAPPWFWRSECHGPVCSFSREADVAPTLRESKGRRLKNRSLHKGADSNLPGWQLPAPVQWRTVHKGGDPKTDQAQRGLTPNSRAGNPKRTRPNCRKNENSQRGWHQSKKGRGPKNSAAKKKKVKGVAAPLASTWLSRQLLGCEQELLELSLCSAPQLSSLRQWHAYLVCTESGCVARVLVGHTHVVTSGVRVASGVRLVHYVGATCDMIPCV